MKFAATAVIGTEQKN
ncbi:hypothetical protein EUS_18180 [[Eubacterium] siraeum 70/3]|uniref:Uncharacterized protein n=1 Tax=[Eubacterium] siraeum 70/3 TaxID=657319 RepID=D4JUW9_9FIRM|nr:hypothetical protein EUS_18180 [[Eubacterium] siraeum 70/3]